MKELSTKSIRLSSALLLLFLLGQGCQPKQELPNILILVADDAGWEDFGSYGNEYIATPNIDHLAQNGKIATNAFLTIAQCSPSRISILSGRYPHATGAEDLHMPTPDTIQLLPSVLKQRNYFTGLLRKSHLGPHGDAQFDFMDRSLDALDQFVTTANDRPFFLWVGFTDPHRPYEDSIISNSQNPDKVKVLPYWKDDQATRKDMANYYDEIRRMDSQIGSYVSTLKEKMLLNKTIIIFISDNGAPFPRAKGTVYDSGIKTPLIIHWPDQIGAGQRTDALISLVDLAPSIAQLLSLDPSHGTQGASIPGLFSNEETKGRQYIFAERNWHNCDEHIRTVRNKRFKLIKNAYFDVPHGTAADIGGSPAFKSLLSAKNKDELTPAQKVLFEVPRAEFEFYDLESDPYEVNNVINDESYKQIINELKGALETWISHTDDFPPTERRRYDNTDRFTGEKFDQTKLPASITESD